MVAPVEQSIDHYAEEKIREFRAMELVAGELDLSTEELDRQLRDRSDLYHEQTDYLRELIANKVKLLLDDGD